jgi:DNA-binding GntR family transcriptional regulator
MDTQELVAQMITRTSGTRRFEDWPEVLAAYAACLDTVQHKLTRQELENFINLGADFYRTLARAEDYRRGCSFGAGS